MYDEMGYINYLTNNANGECLNLLNVKSANLTLKWPLNLNNFNN